MSAPTKELWARVVQPVADWVRSVRGGRAHAPAAELRLEIGPSVPGWVFDVVLLVSGLGAVLCAGVGAAALPGLVALAFFSVLVVGVRSVRHGDHVFVVTAAASAGALYLFTPASGYSWRAASLVLLLHACARASWFASATSATSRVEVAVLAREGRRFVAFTAVGQALVLLAGALADVRDAGDVSTDAAFAVAGGVALLGLAGVVLLPRLRTGA